MIARLRACLLLAVWLLPASPVKNAVLRRLGHDVHATARARANLVWRVGVVRMGPRSRIGRYNMIKHMRRVEIGDGASIGRWNVVSSHPVYARLLPGGAELVLGARSYITSRHQLDCSGGFDLGELAAVAGHQTRIMTHSIDLARNAQTAYRSGVGDRSFIGARCLILGGARFPARSVLAAGSVLPAAKGLRESGLWAGVPAVRKADASGAWFDRDAMSTDDLFVPSTGEVIHKAL